MESSSLGDVLVERAAPSDVAARSALWAYTDDVASRWYGRPATDEEIAAAVRDDPSGDLVAPHGAFLIARREGAVVGCGGVRLLANGIGEVKRLFVTPGARGQGLGRRLMLELETVARAEGVQTLRLDTRSDLVEARALYAALGYVEVPAFNDGRYAEHWFAKDVRASTGRRQAARREPIDQVDGGRTPHASMSTRTLPTASLVDGAGASVLPS